jgi:hypothetical protein
MRRPDSVWPRILKQESLSLRLTGVSPLTGRRCDLGLVVVMLSLVMLVLQLQPHG